MKLCFDVMCLLRPFGEINLLITVFYLRLKLGNVVCYKAYRVSADGDACVSAVGSGLILGRNNVAIVHLRSACRGGCNICQICV